MDIWKWHIRPLLTLTLPWTPRGRQIRIEHAMEATGRDREVCTYVVYKRDQLRGFKLTAAELEELEKIVRGFKLTAAELEELVKNVI